MEINSKIFNKPHVNQTKSILSNSTMTLIDKEKRCSHCKEKDNKYIMILNKINQFGNIINERANNIFNKLPILSIQDVNLPIEYYLSIIYNDIQKELSNDKMLYLVYQILNSMKIIGQKIEIMLSKQNTLESLISEIKTNHCEYSIPKSLQNEGIIDNVDEIIKNFNQNKDLLDSSLKDMKSLLSTSPLMSNTNNNHETITYDNPQSSNTFILNELHRLSNENISLKSEINYIYLSLKNDNKLLEIKDEKGNNSEIVIQSNNMKEQYMIVRRYIKSLMEKDFYLY